ncbi:MAG: hypothetical protein GVY13_12330 [Alphaproteobacteria bacterium]|jgi:hypothetical protein|nr:hypothetical protein [Alphaproteobacteria bacterium]
MINNTERLNEAELIEFYKNLRAFETDYDRSQGGLRYVAALWLLAGFGALAYALFFLPREYGTNGYIEGLAAAWLCLFGIFLLWILDQILYQSLLHSVFTFGLYIEFRDARLPGLRRALYLRHKNVSMFMSLYYILPVGVLSAVIYLIYFSIEVPNLSPANSHYAINQMFLHYLDSWILLTTILIDVVMISYAGFAVITDYPNRSWKIYPDEFFSWLKKDIGRSTEPTARAPDDPEEARASQSDDGPPAR